MLNYHFYCWGTISLILRKWNLSTKIFKLTKHPCFLCPRSANWRWDNFIFIYFKFDPTSKKKLPSPFPLYTWIVKSTAQEGPVPAKSFYGDVDPITSLKVLKAVPTLKSAFSSRAGEVKESPKEPATKKNKGKSCSGYFGCKNNASFVEQSSGTVYCRDHRPKQIPTVAILVEKGKKKKP